MYIFSGNHHFPLIIAKTQFKDNQNMVIYEITLSICIEIMNYFFHITRDTCRYRSQETLFLKDNARKLACHAESLKPPNIYHLLFQGILKK